MGGGCEAPPAAPLAPPYGGHCTNLILEFSHTPLPDIVGKGFANLAWYSGR